MNLLPTLLLLFVCVTFSQSNYNISAFITYSSNNCSDPSFTAFVGTFQNQCAPNTDGTFTITFCNSTYSETMDCSDSQCTQNCNITLNSFTPTDTCMGANGVGLIRKCGTYSASDFPAVDTIWMVRNQTSCGSSITPYTIVGKRNICIPNGNQGIILLCDSSQLLGFTYSNTNCTGTPTLNTQPYDQSSTFGNSSCLPIGFQAFCNNPQPNCFGLYPIQNPCSGKGSCIATNTCSCQLGYSGFTCSVPSCFGVNATSSSVCSGYGTCISLDTCSCQAGYSGLACSIPTCYGINGNSTSVCSGYGTCTSLNTCSCQLGYSGTTCSFTSCFGVNATSPSVCSGNGNCTSLDSCRCKTGYCGTTCSTPCTSGTNLIILSSLFIFIILLQFL